MTGSLQSVDAEVKQLLAEEAAIDGGEKPYASHIEICCLRLSICQAVGERGEITLKQWQRFVADPDACLAEVVDDPNASEVLTKTKAMLARTQSDLGTYVPIGGKFDELNTAQHLKSCLSELEICPDKESFLAKTKEMSTIKTRIASLVRQTRAAAKDLKEAMEKHIERTKDADDQAAVVTAGARVAEDMAAAAAASKAQQVPPAQPELFKIASIPVMKKIQVATDAESIERALVDEGIRQITEPLVVRFAKLSEAIAQSPDYKKEAAEFFSDFVLSREFNSFHGRAAKQIDGNMQIESELFHACRVPGELVVGAAELAALKLQPKAHEWLQSRVSSTSTFIWGMAPQKWWCGIEQAMIGSVRLQMVGFRHLVYAPFKAVQKILVPEGSPAPSEDDFFAKVLSLNPDEAASLVSNLGSEVWSVTCGPGDFVVAPPGTLFIERTLNAAAYGLKRTWVPSDTSSLEASGSARFRKSKSSVLLTDTIKQIQESRAPAGGAA